MKNIKEIPAVIINEGKKSTRFPFPDGNCPVCGMDCCVFKKCPIGYATTSCLPKTKEIKGGNAVNIPKERIKATKEKRESEHKRPVSNAPKTCVDLSSIENIANVDNEEWNREIKSALEVARKSKEMEKIAMEMAEKRQAKIEENEPTFELKITGLSLEQFKKLSRFIETEGFLNKKCNPPMFDKSKRLFNTGV